MEDRETLLSRRQNELDALEKAINEREQLLLAKEKEQKRKEKEKKQLLLRLSPSLWEKLVILAERDFRSINGEIEFLLHEMVEKSFKNKGEKV